MSRWLWYPFTERVYQVEVLTFKRSDRNPSMWIPRKIVFSNPAEKVITSFAAVVQKSISKFQKGPKSLLVFVNPYGGRKRASKVYAHVVAPVFQRAGIKVSVHVTKFGGFAKEKILGKSLFANYVEDAVSLTTIARPL